MQKGAGAAGAGYAKWWRGLLGVRFAKWWGWWGAGLRHGMGVGSLAHRQSGSGRGGGGEAGTSILVLGRGGGGGCWGWNVRRGARDFGRVLTYADLPKVRT
jgi:hypothetical protein